MNLAEKLRQQQKLKELNGTRLERTLSISVHQPQPNRESDLASIPPPSFEPQLERMRVNRDSSRAKAKAAVSGNEEKLLQGGTVRTNSKGSFVHFASRVPTGLTNSLVDPSPLLSGLRKLVELSAVRSLDCSLNQVAFLDTETTGLAGGAGTCAFLVGVGAWDDDGFRVEQYFMRDYHEERAMLQALLDRLSSVQVLVTFNGKSFDVPLLQSRFVLARQNWPLTGALHLDLLHPARRLWKARLGNCSLGNLEAHLFQKSREIDVPGSEIPRIYFNFARTGNPAGIEEVLRHNQQDIETLTDLVLQMGRVLRGPQVGQPPEDLFSTGKYFGSLGQPSLAVAYAEFALKSEMKPELRMEVMQLLAGLLKSQKHYRRAAELWRRVIEEFSDPDESVYEELAIYYEHRDRNLGEALVFTDFAINRLGVHPTQKKWQHRRQRLVRKIEKRNTKPAALQFKKNAPALEATSDGMPASQRFLSGFKPLS